MRPQPVMKTNICSCRSKLIIQSVIQVESSLAQRVNIHLKYDKELTKNNIYLFLTGKFSNLEFVLPTSEVEECSICAIATIVRAMHMMILTEAKCAQNVLMHIDQIRNVIKDLKKDEKEKPAAKPKDKQDRAKSKRTKVRKSLL